MVDVERPDVGDKSFAQSRWRRRAWTLQELIAPSIVQFLSKDSKLISTRASIASPKGQTQLISSFTKKLLDIIGLNCPVRSDLRVVIHPSATERMASAALYTS